MTDIFLSKISKLNLTMIDVAKISAKGQLVIPERIRKALSLNAGSRVLMRMRQNELILVPEAIFESELLRVEQEVKEWNRLLEKSLESDWNNDSDNSEWGKYL